MVTLFYFASSPCNNLNKAHDLWQSSKKVICEGKSDGADFSFHRTHNKQKLFTEMIYAFDDLQI